mmetsp:Transcript_16642/g.33684  ORF Transcript_16642/g.33684 Transcript_16642/m.33684 type:complete len:263 (-) Transcript_16642:157-945(-)
MWRYLVLDLPVVVHNLAQPISLDLRNPAFVPRTPILVVNAHLFGNFEFFFRSSWQIGAERADPRVDVHERMTRYTLGSHAGRNQSKQRPAVRFDNRYGTQLPQLRHIDPCGSEWLSALQIFGCRVPLLTQAPDGLGLCLQCTSEFHNGHLPLVQLLYVVLFHVLVAAVHPSLHVLDLGLKLAQLLLQEFFRLDLILYSVFQGVEGFPQFQPFLCFRQRETLAGNEMLHPGTEPHLAAGVSSYARVANHGTIGGRDKQRVLLP